MRFVTLMVAGLLLSACFTSEPETRNQAAERQVTEDLVALFPGIDAGPAANCVVDQATSPEIEILAAGGAGTQSVTGEIFDRPGTLACLSANGVIEFVEDA